MVLATVLSASREAVRSHRTSTHDGRVAVDLLAPQSRRRNHVVSCELYTSEGLYRGVQERYKQDYISQAAVERTSDKQSNKQAGLTRPAHVPVHTDISLG